MRNVKKVLLDLNAQNNTFTNKDVRKAITSIAFQNESDRQKCFMFLDPPYLGCENNYSHSFTESDSADLFKTAVDSRIPFAMSEFDQQFILEQARHYKLNIHALGERQNMKNRRTEILITNYQLNQPTLFWPTQPIFSFLSKPFSARGTKFRQPPQRCKGRHKYAQPQPPPHRAEPQ